MTHKEYLMELKKLVSIMWLAGYTIEEICSVVKPVNDIEMRLIALVFAWCNIAQQNSWKKWKEKRSFTNG